MFTFVLLDCALKYISFYQFTILKLNLTTLTSAEAPRYNTLLQCVIFCMIDGRDGTNLSL